MFVKFLGHACTLIETKNKRIIIDPWIIGPCNVNAWYTLRNKAATKKEILNTYLLKTSKLFEFCLMSPFVMKKSSTTNIDNARRYGRNFGIIYQIIDDILDLDGKFKKIGKTSGKDKRSKKTFLTHR